MGFASPLHEDWAKSSSVFREEGARTPFAAHGWELEVYEVGMFADVISVAHGRHPGMVAGIHVDCRDARVGRLEEGEAFGALCPPAAATVGVVDVSADFGAGGVEVNDGVTVARGDVEDAGFWVDCRSGPVRSASTARAHDGALEAGWREEGAHSKVLDVFPGELVQFGREIDQVVERCALIFEGGGVGRKGLRGGGALAGMSV